MLKFVSECTKQVLVLVYVQIHSYLQEILEINSCIIAGKTD